MANAKYLLQAHVMLSPREAVELISIFVRVYPSLGGMNPRDILGSILWFKEEGVVADPRMNDHLLELLVCAARAMRHGLKAEVKREPYEKPTGSAPSYRLMISPADKSVTFELLGAAFGGYQLVDDEFLHMRIICAEEWVDRSEVAEIAEWLSDNPQAIRSIAYLEEVSSRRGALPSSSAQWNDVLKILEPAR